VRPAIEAAIDVPFLHLADATATPCRRRRGDRGPARHPLHDGAGLLPVAGSSARPRRARARRADRTIVHDVIYDELVRGVVRPESKAAYVEVIERLIGQGVPTGVIAGCTEIELLVGADDVDASRGSRPPASMPRPPWPAWPG
jgi:aspartate racemase